jgi:hypothetical protein
LRDGPIFITHTSGSFTFSLNFPVTRSANLGSYKKFHILLYIFYVFRYVYKILTFEERPPMSDFLKRALLVAALATTQVQAGEETTPTPNTNFPQNTTGTASTTAVSGPTTNTAVSRSAVPSLARGGPVCAETGVFFRETFCSSSQVRVVESYAVVEGDGGGALTPTDLRLSRHILAAIDG